MRPILVLSAAVVLMAGCNPAPPQDVTGPRNALTRLTVAAGYGVAGIPSYDGQRWMANVSVPGCAGKVTVVSPEAPVMSTPMSFTVLSVDGVSLADTNPGAIAAGLEADNLVNLNGMRTRLDCDES